MDEKEILYRFNYAYRKFYTIPKVIKYCSKMRSLAEFKWFVNAGISVVRGKLRLNRRAKI